MGVMEEIDIDVHGGRPQNCPLIGRLGENIRNENLASVPFNSLNEERGSALLIVLFFLSMSFALAVGFAFLVRSERSILDSSLHRNQSQLFAESALTQAIGVLRSTYNPADGTDDNHDRYPATVPGKSFYSPAAGPFVGRSYWCSTSSDHSAAASFLAVPMGEYTFIPNAKLDVSDPQDPIEEDRGFIPILADGVLMGRAAFMIIDESGKLDPNKVTSFSGSESSGSSERIGASAKEINLEDADLGNFNSYVLNENERWFSIRQIARQLNVADFEEQVIKVLHPFSRDKEQYWNDDNNNNVVDSDEIYDRLDITSATEMSLANLYKTFIAPNDADSELPDIGDVNADNDCSWLKQLGDDGIFATGTERRLVAAQIAVNMKDYIDEDSEATVAWVTNSGELSTTAPGPTNTEAKVYGRENQYGISELSAKIETSVSGTGEDAELQISVYFMGELYLPELEDSSLGFHELTIDFSLAAESVGGVEEIFFNNTSIQINLDSTTNEFGGTLWYSSDWNLAGNETKDDLFDDVSNEYKITNFQIESCVLNNGTTDIDIFPSQPGNDYWWNWQSSSYLTGANNLYITLEAYDPLNNSQDEDGPVTSFQSLWRVTPGGEATLPNTDSSAIGQLTLLDDGTSVSLSEYGQVHVKNGPFDRVGELGRVGSYWPGRSIRLWAANSDDEAGTDTHFLDLFKVGVDDEEKGRVNINTMNSDVLTALLANTTTIPITDAVASILDKRNTVTFNNIGDIFQISGLSGSDKTQDNLEEEMVTKIAELITVRQTYFTIVVAAQSIKDIGNQVFYKDLNNDGDSYDTGETIETKFGEYDPHADRILSTTKLLAVVYRDAFTNEFTIEHIEYLK